MGKRIYVGNIPFKTTEEQVKELFSAYGEVESVSIIIDSSTGRSKGFGFIEMQKDDDAQKAIEALNGAPLMGRPLSIAEAKPRQAQSNDGRIKREYKRKD